MKYLKPIGLLLIIIALIGGVVLWQKTSFDHYQTSPVTRGKAVEAIYATAVVEPLKWAAIAPIKTGRITELNVKEGDVVKAGDILARLDDGDLPHKLKSRKPSRRFTPQRSNARRD